MAHADEGADITLYDQAVLEAMAVRETLFAIGDDALIELADALLLELGRAAGRCLGGGVSAARLPVAA